MMRIALILHIATDLCIFNARSLTEVGVYIAEYIVLSGVIYYSDIFYALKQAFIAFLLVIRKRMTAPGY